MHAQMSAAASVLSESMITTYMSQRATAQTAALTKVSVVMHRVSCNEQFYQLIWSEMYCTPEAEIKSLGQKRHQLLLLRLE